MVGLQCVKGRIARGGQVGVKARALEGSVDFIQEFRLHPVSYGKSLNILEWTIVMKFPLQKLFLESVERTACWGSEHRGMKTSLETVLPWTRR